MDTLSALAYDDAVIRLRALGCLAAVVLLSGCGAWAPVVEPGVTLSEDGHGGTRTNGSVSVTVQTVAWREEPYQSLQRYVLPLYIRVRNDGAATVSFDPANVVAVDEEDTLYRPIPPERLEQIMSTPPYPDGAHLMGIMDTYNPDFAGTLAALGAGNIDPGTQVRGAVFFPLTMAYARRLTVRVPVAGDIFEFGFRAR